MKNPICDYSRSNQMPYTDQIQEFAFYVRNYFCFNISSMGASLSFALFYGECVLVIHLTCRTELVTDEFNHPLVLCDNGREENA